MGSGVVNRKLPLTLVSSRIYIHVHVCGIDLATKSKASIIGHHAWMFIHLCSACEEVVRTVLTANGRSASVYVFYQVSFPRSIHPSERHAVEEGVRKYILMIQQKYLYTCTCMIGHLVLHVQMYSLKKTPVVAKVYFVTQSRLLPN